jgi:NAD(P)-dependent dehydrogenase (short-subunit alcohol dehydrogenase family)
VSPQAGPLDGSVALVTGPSRGAGRGTAVALGEAGATVYCTGRTTRERRSKYNRPETIKETADFVTEAGGVGVAVPGWRYLVEVQGSRPAGGPDRRPLSNGVDETLFRSAAEATEMVRSKEASARELTELLLARIDAVNPADGGRPARPVPGRSAHRYDRDGRA